MAKLTPVEGNPSLVRDDFSGAILNINTSEAERARARKRARIKEQQEINELKNDVNEIKSLLKQILEVTNGNNNS